MAGQARVEVVLGPVEEVGREDGADAERYAGRLGSLHDRPEQPEVGDGGEVVAADAGSVDAGVGAGTDCGDDVVEAEPFHDRAAAAHPHQAAATEVNRQLGGVDAERRHANAGAHDGYRTAVVGAGEAEHVADAGHLPGVGQVLLGDPARP